jgi:hypothetical protein
MEKQDKTYRAIRHDITRAKQKLNHLSRAFIKILRENMGLMNVWIVVLKIATS